MPRTFANRRTPPAPYNRPYLGGAKTQQNLLHNPPNSAIYMPPMLRNADTDIDAILIRFTDCVNKFAPMSLGHFN